MPHPPLGVTVKEFQVPLHRLRRMPMNVDGDGWTCIPPLTYLAMRRSFPTSFPIHFCGLSIYNPLFNSRGLKLNFSNKEDIPDLLTLL